MGASVSYVLGTIGLMIGAHWWDRRRVERYGMSPLRFKKTAVGAGAVAMPVLALVISLLFTLWSLVA